MKLNLHSKNVLDERELQEMYRVEHLGLWLMYGLLFAAVVMQALMEKKITGEQIIPLSKTILISCAWFILCMLTMLLFKTPAVVRYVIAVCIAVVGLKYFLPQLKGILKMLKASKKPKN